MFRAEIVGGELTPDGDEVHECRWFALDEAAPFVYPLMYRPTVKALAGASPIYDEITG